MCRHLAAHGSYCRFRTFLLDSKARQMPGRSLAETFDDLYFHFILHQLRCALDVFGDRSREPLLEV